MGKNDMRQLLERPIDDRSAFAPTPLLKKRKRTKDGELIEIDGEEDDDDDDLDAAASATKVPRLGDQ